MNILLMYHELYLNAYSDEEWPFEGINRELCIKFFNRSGKNCGELDFIKKQ